MDFEEFGKGNNSCCLFVDLKGHILPEKPCLLVSQAPSSEHTALLAEPGVESEWV